MIKHTKRAKIVSALVSYKEGLITHQECIACIVEINSGVLVTYSTQITNDTAISN